MKYLKKIKTEAARRNIPLKQLADSINISEDVFKRSIKNGTLSLEQLNAVCRELNIEVSEIFALDKTVELKMEKSLNFLSSKLFC